MAADVCGLFVAAMGIEIGGIARVRSEGYCDWGQMLAAGVWLARARRAGCSAGVGKWLFHDMDGDVGAKSAVVVGIRSKIATVVGNPTLCRCCCEARDALDAWERDSAAAAAAASGLVGGSWRRCRGRGRGA